MEQTNCPNCGAPLTGCRCEYCGTVDTAVEREARETAQKLKVEIDRLLLFDRVLKDMLRLSDLRSYLPAADEKGKVKNEL